MGRIFFKGFITLLPIAITIYILYSAVIILENLLGSFLRWLMPHYVPGLGLLLTLGLIFLFGLILNHYLVERLLRSLEKNLLRVPFVKAVYSPLRDLMNLFSKGGEKQMKSVVLVKLSENGARAMGVVTRDQFGDLPFADKTKNKVAVYFPLSYGLGGFTFLIPRENIEEIDLPIEKAMSLAITGWVGTKQGSSEGDQT